MNVATLNYLAKAKPCQLVHQTFLHCNRYLDWKRLRLWTATLLKDPVR